MTEGVIDGFNTWLVNSWEASVQKFKDPTQLKIQQPAKTGFSRNIILTTKSLQLKKKEREGRQLNTKRLRKKKILQVPNI